MAIQGYPLGVNPAIYNQNDQAVQDENNALAIGFPFKVAQPVVDPNNIYSKYGVDAGGDKRAQELSAAITRQQFNDYQTRFMPYLQKLNGMVTPEAVQQQQKDWTTGVMSRGNLGLQQGIDANNRNLARYGAAVDPRVQASGLRNAQLNSAANTVAQVNEGNQQIKDRGMVLLSGQKMSPNA